MKGRPLVRHATRLVAPVASDEAALLQSVEQ